MNTYKFQEKIIWIGVMLQMVAALFFLLFSQSLEGMAISGHFVQQCGNLLLLAAFVNMLSGAHLRLQRHCVEERAEIEKLAGDSRRLFHSEAASVGQYQQTQKQFNKYILPIILNVITITEICLAVWVIHNEKTHDHLILAKDLSPMLVVAGVMFSVAIILFLLGKYCSALAYLPNGGYLRPLCGTMIANSIFLSIGGLIALLYYWRLPVAATWYTWCLCILALLLAGERIVTWLMEFYRPQTGKQIFVPVYESRFLALFSQPRGIVSGFMEIVEYQFGFRLSDTSLLQALRKIVIPFLVIQCVSLWLLTSLVFIPHDEVGILQSGNHSTPKLLAPGLHIKPPYPFKRVYRVQASRILMVPFGGLTVDTETSAPPQSIDDENKVAVDLWSNVQYNAKLYLSPSPPSSTSSTGNITATSATANLNLLSAGFYLYGVIDDPIDYYLQHQDPYQIMVNLANKALTQYFLTVEWQKALSVEMSLHGKELKTRLQRLVDNQQLGVKISSIEIARLQPPPAVASIYNELLNSWETARRTRSEAEQYSFALNAAVQHEANTVIRRAEAETAYLVQAAEVEKNNFLEQRKIYHQYPQLYKTRETMEYVESWLRDVPKFILTSKRAHEIINLELKPLRPDLLSLPGN